MDKVDKALDYILSADYEEDSSETLQQICD